MKDYPKNNNTESVWDTIIDVIKLILFFFMLAFVIYIVIVSFRQTLEDLLFLFLLMILYGICTIIGDGVLSLFDD